MKTSHDIKRKLTHALQNLSHKTTVAVNILRLRVNRFRMTNELTSLFAQLGEHVYENNCYAQDEGVLEQVAAITGQLANIEAATEQIEDLKQQKMVPAPIEDHNCVRCGATIAEGSRFCCACGLPTTEEVTQHPCSHCGQSFEMETNYCVFCGVRKVKCEVEGGAVAPEQFD